MSHISTTVFLHVCTCECTFIPQGVYDFKIGKLFETDWKKNCTCDKIIKYQIETFELNHKYIFT